jgi:3'-phosphoadenosine 5'-phosphosulfate sulfotransferase (PAPS reductase)/FAD synthetase
MAKIAEIASDKIEALEQSTPQEDLRRACSEFRCIYLSASFGKNSVTLHPIVRDIRPDGDVGYPNTGYDFHETVEYFHRLEKEWGSRVIEFSPWIRVAEAANHLMKVNPHAAWTTGDLRHSLRENRVPYSPLYDRCFVSLGCRSRTLAGTWGRVERDGRWAVGEYGIRLASPMIGYDDAEADPHPEKEPDR